MSTHIEEAAPATTASIIGTPKRRLGLKQIGLALLIVIALVAGAVYALNARHFESTDDAQVDGHFAALSSRVTGTVLYINPNVENDRAVNAGDLLLALDPRDAQADLDHAKANLEVKEADARVAALKVPIMRASAYSALDLARASKEQASDAVGGAQSELTAAQHRVQLDQALADRAERDRVRYQALVDKHEISKSFYDARETEALGTIQTLESDKAAASDAQQKIAQMQAVVKQRKAQIDNAGTAPQQTSDAEAEAASARASVDQARADVQTAELNLSYTKIYAPVSGVVGHKTVELGHRVQPGQSLLTVVPLDDIWVTANYKETQLRRMHPGQEVTLDIDSSGRSLHGKVEDMAGAAGPLFSLFPPENASGNYVKSCNASRFGSMSTLDRTPITSSVLACLSKPRSASGSTLISLEKTWRPRQFLLVPQKRKYRKLRSIPGSSPSRSLSRRSWSRSIPPSPMCRSLISVAASAAATTKQPGCLQAISWPMPSSCRCPPG